MSSLGKPGLLPAWGWTHGATRPVPPGALCAPGLGAPFLPVTLYFFFFALFSLRTPRCSDEHSRETPGGEGRAHHPQPDPARGSQPSCRVSLRDPTWAWRDVCVPPTGQREGRGSHGAQEKVCAPQAGCLAPLGVSQWPCHAHAHHAATSCCWLPAPQLLPGSPRPGVTPGPCPHAPPRVPPAPTAALPRGCSASPFFTPSLPAPGCAAAALPLFNTSSSSEAFYLLSREKSVGWGFFVPP